MERTATREAAEEAAAASVGLHLRGHEAFVEGNTDEDDPKRYPFHSALKDAAAEGAAGDAEAVLDDMARAGLVPGPRAFHAVVFAYVVGSNPAGALATIRRCWDAGMTPLPQTYAAVVAALLAAGDVEKAEAVAASNRRAGVDWTKSWQQLVAGLFRLGQADKAVELYEEGQAEGLAPSSAVCQALVEHLCAQGEPGRAKDVLLEMREHNLAPSMRHHAPVIRALTAAGELEDAYSCLLAMLCAPDHGGAPQGVQALCDLVLEAQMAAADSPAAAALVAQRMKDAIGMTGQQPGPRFFAARLQTALRVQDLQMAMQGFRALRKRLTSKPLALVDDAMLTELLLQASAAGLPAELYEVLSAMSREQRAIPEAAMQPDEHGCTVLAAWVRQRLQNAASQQPGGGDGDAEAALPLVPQPRAPIEIDGVSVDPRSLCALDDKGAPLAVSRMGVREMRAELAARRANVAGNKKELAKRLQKLRQIDGEPTVPRPLARPSAPQKAESDSKYKLRVTEHFWVEGKLVEEVTYEADAAAEEEDEEGEEGGDLGDDMDDERVRRMRYEDGTAALMGARDEGDEDDDELSIPDDTTASYMLSATPHFSNLAAGPHDAVALALGAVADLGAQPSAADLATLADYVAAARDGAAAVLLAAALDCQPNPQPGTADLRERLGTLAAEAAGTSDFDVEGAVAAVLGDKAGAEELRAIREEVAEFL